VATCLSSLRRRLPLQWLWLVVLQNPTPSRNCFGGTNIAQNGASEIFWWIKLCENPQNDSSCLPQWL